MKNGWNRIIATEPINLLFPMGPDSPGWYAHYLDADGSPVCGFGSDSRFKEIEIDRFPPGKICQACLKKQEDS